MLFDFCALLNILVASQIVNPGLQSSTGWGEQIQKVDQACQAQKKEAAEKAAKEKKEEKKK